MLSKTIVLGVFCLNYVFVSVQCTLVHTDTGRVEGKLKRYGKTSYYSYEGIPFAEPPVGDLRFRPPVPIKPWKKIFKAFAPGAVCPQIEYNHRRSEMNESCLFLNIYVPRIAGNKRLPVVFVIHGGYYIYNSGKPEPINGPQLMLEKGNIVVTTNYRVGALGFLSYDDSLASGNAGLKDIIVAGKWIKRNIGKFKGDENRICLFGWGAGAALGHYLLLTNETSGIFFCAVLRSGSAFSYRALQLNPKENALKLIKQLGIQCNDNCCIKKLKDIDPFKIVEAEITLIENDPRRAFIYINCFSPVVEKPSPIALITRSPLDIIQTEGLVQKIPVITGFNNQEGLEIFNVLKTNPNAVDNLNNNFELCIPPNINYPIGSRERKSLAKSIRERYFGGRNISIFNVQNYINLITDTAYAYGIDYWIKVYQSQKTSSSVYYYFFEFDGQLNWGKLRYGITYPGACHGDQIGYVFLTSLTRDILQNLDDKTATRLQRSLSIITNFTTYGNPTPGNGGFQWIEAGPNRNYAVISTSNMNGPPLKDRLEFWYEEYEKYALYERKNGRRDEFCDS